MKRRSFQQPVILLAAVLTLAAFVAGEAPPDRLSRKTIAQRVNAMLAQGENARATWGISVMDLETGGRVLGLNPDRLFIPASIQKLITGYAGWREFGPDYRGKTGILTDGSLDGQGVLQGNLIVRGSGDPSWSYRFFGDDYEKPVQAFVDQLLRKVNLREVRGDLVADDTAFLYEPYAPALSWEDFQWAYGVRITALGFNDQVMALEITPGAKGQPATFRTIPAFLAAGLRGQVVSRPGAVLQDLISFKPFDSDVYYLKGAVSTGGALLIKMAVTDPAELAGRWIAEELRRRGVAIRGTVRVEHRFHYLPAPPQSPPFRTLADIEGLPLAQILDPMMKKSINPEAELLLRQIGAKQARVNGPEREAGIAAIYSRWPDLMEPGVNIVMLDGSGLSRQNLLTPRLVTGLLEIIGKSPDFEPFRNLLSASGTSGTMKGRLGGKTAGLVFAKTGKLGLVVSMAGYVQTLGGRWLAFCIVTNNHPARKSDPKSTIDAIVKLLTRY